MRIRDENFSRIQTPLHPCKMSFSRIAVPRSGKNDTIARVFRIPVPLAGSAIRDPCTITSGLSIDPKTQY